MTIRIDNKSGQPIYEQIVAQLRRQILSGEMAEDTPLPSLRDLARDLRISVITTKRAYEELEAAGLVYTVPGKGSFVAARDMELLREEQLRQIETHLGAALALSRQAGLDRAALLEIIDTLEEEGI